MRLRSTLILILLLLGLGAYLYFVEAPRMAKEGEKQTLFDFKPDDVTAVTLAYPDRQIALKRGDTGWRLTAPVDSAADETAVTNLLRAIADCEVKKTIDDAPADLAPFGLAPPAATVMVTLTDRTLPDLRVGKTSPVGFSTYLQRADETKLYLTGSGFQSGMTKQVKDLRDKTIVTLNEDDVRRITLRSGDSTVVLAKGDGGWTIEQPGPYKADANAVRSLLSSVGNLRAIDFASDAPSDADLATYGLDQPQATVTLSRAGDAGDVQVLVGKEGEQGLYVRTAERPTTYIAGKWVARDLTKSAADLRDKTLLSFDPKSATAVEVTRADGERFVLTSANDAWTIEGSDKPVNKTAVDAFVSALSRLSGTQVLADAPADLAAYGLAPPALTIAVRGANDAALGTVRLGSYTPNPPQTEYTVTRDDQPAVFSLREFQFKQLDKHPADLTGGPTPAAESEPPAGEEEPDVE